MGLNSIEDLYLTESTLMKELISESDRDKMYEQVIDDIILNKEIQEYIQKQKRKKRKFLCKLIYSWIKQSSSRVANIFNKHQLYFGELVNYLEKYFGKDVVEEVDFLYYCQNIDYKIKYKNNKIHIILGYGSKFRPYDLLGRLVLKYNEKHNVLYVCYIEPFNMWDFNRHYWQNPKHNAILKGFEVINHVIEQLEEKYHKKPKVVIKRKNQYQKYINLAKQLNFVKYL